MARPLVSVVVPVYNGEKYLRQAIDSALGQTYQPLQVVVVDDGSTDASPTVVASYGERARSIRQPNAGVARARNAGLAAADGELVAFLDQDDWWLPEKVARQVECFQANPDLGLVHTGILQYSESSGGFIEGVYDTGPSPLLQGHCYERLLLGNGVYNSSVMIRKAVIEKAGLFDPGIPGNTCQDYDLWLRIARHYPFGYVAEPLAALRLHPEQGTWNRRAMLGDELRIVERALGEVPRPSRALRTRLAHLLDALGVAHLDAEAPREARPFFARALRARWSARAALLYAASFLPPAGIAWLRRQKGRWTTRGEPVPQSHAGPSRARSESSSAVSGPAHLPLTPLRCVRGSDNPGAPPVQTPLTPLRCVRGSDSPLEQPS
jgi:glycosyltransferase involved in cell wall biosynthesis